MGVGRSRYQDRSQRGIGGAMHPSFTYSPTPGWTGPMYQSRQTSAYGWRGDSSNDPLDQIFYGNCGMRSNPMQVSLFGGTEQRFSGNALHLDEERYLGSRHYNAVVAGSHIRMPERIGERNIHPSISQDPDIHECDASELESHIQAAIDENRYFYIGYTEHLDTDYVRRTLPKSQEWKNKFLTWTTYWADIEATLVTEKKLIGTYQRHPLCTNKRAGKPDTTGYVYVLIGQLAN